MKDKVAALIDMGSNSIRLAIYKLDRDGHYKEIKKEKVAARLINYLDHQGKLNADGLKLILHTLKEFRTTIESFEISDVIGFATAVIRQASNQEDILSEIKKHTGFSFIVLSEYEEAYYGYLSVIDTIDLKDGITIDIGGGSTEITLFKDKEMEEYHSFPFGAVSLNAEFTNEEQVTNTQLMDLRTNLLSQFETLPWLAKGNKPIIGIGGTVRNLGRIYQKKNQTDQNILQFEDVKEILHKLSSMPATERSKIKGLSKKRKDIIIPGIMIILTLMEFVQAPYFMYSEQSVRDGIIKEKLTKK